MSEIMTFIPTTRDKMDLFIVDQKGRFLSGEFDIKQIAVQWKIVADSIEYLRKDRDVVDALIKEIDKFGKGKCTTPGGELSIMEAGVRYDYTDCNDPEWNYLKRALDAREKFLKSIKESNEYDSFDYETGEVNKVRINPPVRKSTTTVKIKIS